MPSELSSLLTCLQERIDTLEEQLQQARDDLAAAAAQQAASQQEREALQQAQDGRASEHQQQADELSSRAQRAEDAQAAAESRIKVRTAISCSTGCVWMQISCCCSILSRTFCHETDQPCKAVLEGPGSAAALSEPTPLSVWKAFVADSPKDEGLRHLLQTSLSDARLAACRSRRQ